MACEVQGMDQSTRESFNLTYKGLLDQLNEKKREGVKFDFAHELKVYERDHELDTIGYFRVRCPDNCPENCPGNVNSTPVYRPEKFPYIHAVREAADRTACAWAGCTTAR